MNWRACLGAVVILAALAPSSSALARDPLWETLPWDARLGVRWFEARAEAGDPAAAARLGRLYEEGVGTTADSDKAMGWYRQAAEAGDAASAFRLALLLQVRAADGDHREAAKWYALAAADEPAAAFNLALMTENGDGVEPDPERAAALYEQAYAGGVEKAALNRALLALRDWPDPDRVTAAQWLMRAEDSAIPEAGPLLAELLPVMTDAEVAAARAAYADGRVTPENSEASANGVTSTGRTPAR